MVEINKQEKESVTTINFIKHITTYICIILAEGARVLNGEKNGCKTEYTHAGCGHESMYVQSFGVLCSKGGEQCE